MGLLGDTGTRYECTPVRVWRVRHMHHGRPYGKALGADDGYFGGHLSARLSNELEQRCQGYCPPIG